MCEQPLLQDIPLQGISNSGSENSSLGEKAPAFYSKNTHGLIKDTYSSSKLAYWRVLLPAFACVQLLIVCRF
jgi:hypothetical protein